jgi:hypothetical protein
MRREGFEMGVSRPQVIIKEIDGERQEPYEIRPLPSTSILVISPLRWPICSITAP